MIQTIEETIKSVRTSKHEILVQIFLVFVIPVFLIQIGIIPLSARVAVLAIVVGIFLAVLIKEKWTLPMFHLDIRSAKKYFVRYLAFTVIGIILIVSLGEKIGNEEFTRWWTYPHFLYLFLIVSLLQEVAYRGYLIPALGKLTSKPAVIIFFNAVVFTYLHALFINPHVGLPLAFIGGIGFAMMYLKYPSLPLIILAHSALNFTAVLYGFFIVHGGI